MFTVFSRNYGTLEETGLDGYPALLREEPCGDFTHISLSYQVDACQQDDLFACLHLAFEPDYVWTAHLTPSAGYIAQQHIFRTPALIAQNDSNTVILIPDVSAAERSTVPYYLDLDAPKRAFMIGMSLSRVAEHVLFQKTPGAVFHGAQQLNFFLFHVPERLENPFRMILSFYWERRGRSDSRAHLPELKHIPVYIEHAYGWAFDRWRDIVWQEFDWNGRRVGAPAFIVTASQSPGNPGEKKERESLSIWNHAWFNALRGASGLFRYAREHRRDDLKMLSQLTKELALSFPQDDGLFDCLIAAKNETLMANGREVTHSLGWNTRYLGNSDRNPLYWDLQKAPRHILDMACTADYMLIWFDELERDERLFTYAAAFADRLLRLQDSRGYYPAWILHDGTPLGILDDSPESAMAAAFLLHFAALGGGEQYQRSALRCLEAICADILPYDRFEDFETYWSCSSFWNDHVGEKIPRNNTYKQCNLSMYYCALALLRAYQATEDKRYLQSGARVLDQLLMTQSSFQPAGMPLPVIGGFGVLNADGELNDERSSLFAPLILEYGRLLGNTEYIERGEAALCAAFSMMYCPENAQARKQWEKRWPFFSPRDYGFTMENYGHDGITDSSGSGIGVFCIYDWGGGAASEGYAYAREHSLI